MPHFQLIFSGWLSTQYLNKICTNLFRIAIYPQHIYYVFIYLDLQAHHGAVCLSRCGLSIEVKRSQKALGTLEEDAREAHYPIHLYQVQEDIFFVDKGCRSPPSGWKPALVQGYRCHKQEFYGPWAN